MKALYITSAIVRLLNIALLLLFFYMAAQFKGKLLTSYKESFERLQNLQIWAEKEDFHSMRNKYTIAPWKRSLKQKAEMYANSAARDADFIIINLLKSLSCESK